MNKIIVIGCPGSGKSTMVFKMKEKLNCPVLHLDKIYHIDNTNHISREELVQRVNEFAANGDRWIIDGNYISTVEQRIQLADTVILLDIDTEICVNNARKRSQQEKREDMAAGFDNTILNEEFVQFILNFKENSLPKIMELFDKYKDTKNIIILKSYEEIDTFLENLGEYHE